MYTQCAHCQTLFRITAKQLKAASGRARCGHCGHVFNALARLVERLPDQPDAPARPREDIPADHFTNDANDTGTLTGQNTGSAASRHDIPAPPPAAPAALTTHRDDATPSFDDLQAAIADRQPPDSPPEPLPRDAHAGQDTHDIHDDAMDIDLAGPTRTDAPPMSPSPPATPVRAAGLSAHEMSDIDVLLKQLARDVESMTATMHQRSSTGTGTGTGTGTQANPGVDNPVTRETPTSPAPRTPATDATVGLSPSRQTEAEVIPGAEPELGLETERVIEPEPEIMAEPAPDLDLLDDPSMVDIDEDEFVITSLDDIPAHDTDEGIAYGTMSSHDVSGSDTQAHDEAATETPYARPVANPTEPRERDAIPDILRATLEDATHPRRNPLVTLAGGVFLLGLLGLLPAQLAYFRGADLAMAFPALRPGLTRFCHLAGCHLPVRRDLARLVMLNKDIRSPGAPKGALQITATIENRADFRQPWPSLYITLSDLTGQVTAARLFHPGEYLAHTPEALRQWHASRGMPIDTPVNIELDVADPGRQAISYQFSFR